MFRFVPRSVIVPVISSVVVGLVVLAGWLVFSAEPADAVNSVCNYRAGRVPPTICVSGEAADRVRYGDRTVFNYNYLPPPPPPSNSYSDRKEANSASDCASTNGGSGPGKTWAFAPGLGCFQITDTGTGGDTRDKNGNIVRGTKQGNCLNPDDPTGPLISTESGPCPKVYCTTNGHQAPARLGYDSNGRPIMAPGQYLKDGCGGGGGSYTPSRSTQNPAVTTTTEVRGCEYYGDERVWSDRLGHYVCVKNPAVTTSTTSMTTTVVPSSPPTASSARVVCPHSETYTIWPPTVSGQVAQVRWRLVPPDWWIEYRSPPSWDDNPATWQYPWNDFDNHAELDRLDRPRRSTGVVEEYSWGRWSEWTDKRVRRSHSPIAHGPRPDPFQNNFQDWTIMWETRTRYVGADPDDPASWSEPVADSMVCTEPGIRRVPVA